MSDRTSPLRWPWLLAAIATGLAFLAIVLALVARIAQEGDAPDGRPLGSASDILRLKERGDLNVLFIVIDTLRAERMSGYGYERPTSPRLDALAASGVRYARHLAQSSWTKCSMASMWTGFYPARTGVMQYDDMVPQEALMPAEILREAGYQTIGLYRNGWVSPNFGFGQGFEVYTRPAPMPVPANLKQASPTIKVGGTDDDVIKTAIEYLRVNGDQRWFLYIHLMDVHEYTYDEESALFGAGYSDVYDNAVLRMDGVVGFLLDHLAEQGFSDDTLIVVASDHGEAFRERGIEGHARRVYRETTEIPLLIQFPFRLEPGLVVEARTRNIDLWPTLLDLLGLPAIPGTDGRSTLPDVLAAAGLETGPREPQLGIAHLDMQWGNRTDEVAPTLAVSDGPLRYVLVESSQERTEELFDAERDPRELVDRSRQHPEDFARLRELGQAYLRSQPVWGDAPTRDISEMELNQLRALGYAIP